MMFWSRFRQSRHHFYAFSDEFKRFYNLNRGPILPNQLTSPRAVAPILNNYKFIFPDSQLEFFSKVRFYSKRSKSRPKNVKEDPWEPRINEQIRDPMVRLVSDEDHYVISTREAMARAESLKMDLVEVDRQANPPVCKIFDYNKQKYLLQNKEKERAKSKIELKKGAPKEVKFTAKITQNDLKIKAEMVRRLMDSGYRVKCRAMDPSDDVDLKTLLSRFSALIQDVAIEETTAKYEKTQAFMVVRHAKFGPPKKSGKQASKATTLDETGEEIEVGSDTEHLDENVQTNESGCAVSNGDYDDGHPIFDINNEDNEQSSSIRSKLKQSATLVGTPSTNTASSTLSGMPKPAKENRYARDPRLSTPPRVPKNMNGLGPNQANQLRFGMNMTPQMRPEQAEVPGYGVPKHDSSRLSNNPKSTPKSYGIFTAQEANTPPHEQNAPPVTNRYKINAPNDPARAPARTTGPSPQRDLPRVPGANTSQGRWGVFNGDNSNVIPNKNRNQSENGRR